jgi:hypothetical protein
MTASRVRIPLSRVKGLGDDVRKKLIRTANHTRGVDCARLTDEGDLICRLNPETARTKFHHLKKKLENRIEDKIKRCQKEARRAARQQGRPDRQEYVNKPPALATT